MLQAFEDWLDGQGDAKDESSIAARDLWDEEASNLDWRVTTKAATFATGDATGAPESAELEIFVVEEQVGSTVRSLGSVATMETLDLGTNNPSATPEARPAAAGAKDIMPLAQQAYDIMYPEDDPLRVQLPATNSIGFVRVSFKMSFTSSNRTLSLI